MLWCASSIFRLLRCCLVCSKQLTFVDYKIWIGCLNELLWRSQNLSYFLHFFAHFHQRSKYLYILKLSGVIIGIKEKYRKIVWRRIDRSRASNGVAYLQATSVSFLVLHLQFFPPFLFCIGIFCLASFKHLMCQLERKLSG